MDPSSSNRPPDLKTKDSPERREAKDSPERREAKGKNSPERREAPAGPPSSSIRQVGWEEGRSPSQTFQHLLHLLAEQHQLELAQACREPPSPGSQTVNSPIVSQEPLSELGQGQGVQQRTEGLSSVVFSHPLTSTDRRSSLRPLWKRISSLTRFRSPDQSDIWNEYAESGSRESMIAEDKPHRSCFMRIPQRIAGSDHFERFCGIAIFANSVYIGVMANQSSLSQDPYAIPLNFLVVGWCFTVLFFVELVIRLLAHGATAFLCGPGRVWNVFDLVMLATSLAENITESFLLLLDQATPLANVGVLRVLRALRLVRTIRIFRLVRWLRELRIMVIAISRSILPLMWSMAIFLSAIYGFAIYLSQQHTFYLYDYGDDAKYQEELQEYYGSVFKSTLTLFMCVTGGINWNLAAKPLVAMSWSNQLLMVFYVFFISVALMNVITGIFVEAAIATAVADKDELIQDQLYNRDSELAQLRTIFAASNFSERGMITKEEFVHHCKDRRVRALLRALGLDVDEACFFFKILDTQNRGELPVQDLVVSCMRLKGSATGLDMAAMMMQFRYLFELLQDVDSSVKGLARTQYFARKMMRPSDDSDARGRSRRESTSSVFCYV